MIGQVRKYFEEELYLWPAVAVGVVVCVGTTHYVRKQVKRYQMQRKMQQRSERTKSNINQLIDRLQKIQIDNEIVHLSFHDLQAKLQNGELTATEVLQAYQSKALEVNDKVNGITDIIQSASARAAQLDTVERKNRGPLHGIPISLKEECGLKGEDCTAGFGELIDIPKAENSVLVKVLKLKGAVPFIRTNLPQGMRSIGCGNPIYGVTKNPLDLTRTSGGSSGGEGAIIGGQGSILGVGSDLAGSIRVPVAFCGICGLKTTAGRMSSVGNFGTDIIGGQKIVLGVDGPMGRDVTSLVQYMKAVIGPELFALDPSLPQLPFRDELLQSRRPLRIGFYVYDECTLCSPAVERAVMEARDALQRLGHTLVEIKAYKSYQAFSEFLVPAILGDDLDGYRDLLKYDDTCEEMYKIYKLCQLPYCVRWVMSKLLQLVTYEPMNIALLERKPIRKLTDWYKLANRHKDFQKEFTDNWTSQKLDAVICPVMPTVATKLDLIKRFLTAASYTALYNVVNYPAGVLPVTKVTAEDVTKTMDSKFYNAKTGLEKEIVKDVKGTEGLPVAVQVVALPFMEEVILRIMSELETALKQQRS